MNKHPARMRLRLLAWSILLLAPQLHAQTFATKPIRIITPFAPGGSTDVLARALGEGLQRELGQPIIVENKTGAGSVLGNDAVSKSPPDGHTLLLTTGSFAIVPSLNARLPYSQQTGFAPITNSALTGGPAVSSRASPSRVIDRVRTGCGSRSSRTSAASSSWK